MNTKNQVLIIGAGPAGLAAADSAAAQGASVTLCGAEPYAPYWRPRLTHCLSEPTEAAALAIRKPEWFSSRGVTLLTGITAEQLDAERKTARFTDGTVLMWDSLVLATGALPNRPNLPCKVPPITLRNFDDAVRLRSAALAVGRAIVVGGGLLGLETAWELNTAGVKTAVIELAPWLMPRQLNQAAGRYLQRRLEESGMEIMTGQDPQTCPGVYEGACVVLCAGVRADLSLVLGTAITAGRSILVDEHMRTNIPGIYACGDAAEFNGRNWCLMTVAQEQGKVAGANAAGGNITYVETPPSPMLKVGALNVLSVGDITEGDGIASLGEETDAGYGCLMIRDSMLVGAVLVGDTKAGMKLKKAVGEQIKVSGALNFSDVIHQL